MKEKSGTYEVLTGECLATAPWTRSASSGAITFSTGAAGAWHPGMDTPSPGPIIFRIGGDEGEGVEVLRFEESETFVRGVKVDVPEDAHAALCEWLRAMIDMGRAGRR